MKVTCTLVAAVILTGRVLFAADAPAMVTDQQFDAALSTAFEILEKDPTKFVATLQPVAARFDVVEPALETKDATWRPVTLNARGKKLDAFRFTVPAGEPRDLVWAF